MNLPSKGGVSRTNWREKMKSTHGAWSAPIALASALALSACGGGGTKDGAAANTSGSTFNSSNGANVSLAGTVATGAVLPGTPITIYDSAGKTCGQTTSNDAGTFTVSAKCAFPVLVVADTPDLEGKALYTVIPSIQSDGQQVSANITPITTVISQLVIGSIPRFGSALSKYKVTATALADADAKVHEVLDPLMAGSPRQDFLGGKIVVGQGQDLLMDSLTITYQSIPTTSQNLFQFQLSTEHRPIVLAHNTKQPISTAYVDDGLGVATGLVDLTRLQKGQAAFLDIKASLEQSSYLQLAQKADSTCFKHNGLSSVSSIFDAPADWLLSPSTRIFNVQLINFNTYTNFENETEERLNNGPADIALISFDFLNGRGLKQRAYTWAINGSQVVNGCSSTGTGWRLLGNQRQVSLQTRTYALHKIMYNSSFAGRTDQYGTGTEHFISDDNSSLKYAYAIVSGPGLPDNGAIFVKLDGDYLKFKGSINSIRTAIKDSTIYDQVEDTKSVLMTDAQIANITDALYSPQNKYVVRFFTTFKDLYPSLTLVDYLPKRPYVNTELKVEYFQSIGVNLDALVTSLQTQTPVTVNWSIPTDFRGRSMLPHYVRFMRKNCRDEKSWPGCSARSQQINEYGLGGRWLESPEVTSSTLTPPSLPPTGSKTFESHVRMDVLDSLNRPLEVSVGMSYQK